MSILAVNCFAINCRYLFWIFSIRFSRYVPESRFSHQIPTGLSGPFLLSGCSFPKKKCLPVPMGLSGLEPPTSRLSGVRSNRLSYKPSLIMQVADMRLYTLDAYTHKCNKQRRCGMANRRFDIQLASKLNKIIWQPPTLPCRLRHSTIGRLQLNRRVRDGYGCLP